MGVAQLVARGDLRPEGGGYRIVRRFAHFPAGLGGAHAVRFVLPRGVRMPAGDPGHSCMVREGVARRPASE